MRTAPGQQDGVERRLLVDFVDYHEIAHHAGVTRRESLDSLTGADQLLGTWRRSRRRTTDYRIVVLSVHGQSQARPSASSPATPWRTRSRNT